MKLTNNHKDIIVKAISGETFAKREARLSKRLERLAPRLYRACVPAAHERKLRALPDGFVQMGNRFSVSVIMADGKTWRDFVSKAMACNYNHSRLSISLTELRPVPHCLYNSGLLLPHDSPVAKDLIQLDRDHLRLEKDREKLERELRNTLASYSTVKKLADAWPEAAKHVPQQVRTTAVAIPPDSVRKLVAELEGAS